jgi:hypothetical protein
LKRESFLERAARASRKASALFARKSALAGADKFLCHARGDALCSAET